MLNVMKINDQGLVQERDGRLFSSQSDLYWLPADDEEFDRLGCQHRVLTTILGLVYGVDELVEKAINVDPETTPAVIDIGTGSGHWAIDFANVHPQASVVGVDLVLPNPKTHVPNNCSFSIRDANLPFEEYRKSFNVCHMRSIDQGIHDYEDLLYRVQDILKTDGVLLLSSGDIQLYTEDFQPMSFDTKEGEPGWCATQAILRQVWMNNGKTSTSKFKWEEWLAKNPYISSYKVCDAYIPIGPWVPGLSDKHAYAAKLMQTNTIQLVEAFRPFLLSEGYDSATIDRLSTTAKTEISQMKPRVYARWRYAWAVRNSVEWVPKESKE
ncbi:hypothetical protein FRC02_012114 [Tulasnella sp. 418]|nr:hypothetical protein FRC02_012114 [Tulasnella sp. 418]